MPPTIPPGHQRSPLRLQLAQAQKAIPGNSISSSRWATRRRSRRSLAIRAVPLSPTLPLPARNNMANQESAKLKRSSHPSFLFDSTTTEKKTETIRAGASAQAVASALRQLNSLPAAEQRRLQVSGQGESLSPWLVQFAEPGTQPLLSIEPSWLQTEQLPVSENEWTGKLLLHLDAATGGTFLLGYNGTNSTALPARPTQAQIEAAFTSILPATTTATVTPVGDDAPNDGNSRFAVTLSSNDSSFDIALVTADTTATTTQATPSVTRLVTGTAYTGVAIGSAQDKQLIRSNLSSGSFKLRYGNRENRRYCVRPQMLRPSRRH